ncbi:MAG: hypothetical protein ACYSTW_10345 [Planctomycetota bacterium]|jgi:hypothetical protein
MAGRLMDGSSSFLKNSAGGVALIKHTYLKVIDTLIMAFVKAVTKPKVE